MAKIKRKARVYLDTSVISALFDEKNPERKLLTETFFKEVESFKACISEVVVMEIEKTPDLDLRRKMKKTISQFSVLPLTNEVEWLTKEYDRYGVFPEDYPEDAYHVAIAVINEMDYVLTWNFKHIVRRKTKDVVRMVNTLNGLKQTEIATPGELL